MSYENIERGPRGGPCGYGQRLSKEGGAELEHQCERGQDRHLS